jgi:hypothetical protein
VVEYRTTGIHEINRIRELLKKISIISLAGGLLIENSLRTGVFFKRPKTTDVVKSIRPDADRQTLPVIPRRGCLWIVYLLQIR